MTQKATEYLYQFVDAKGNLALDDVAEDRETARDVKRQLKKQGENIKIVQYKLIGEVR